MNVKAVCNNCGFVGMHDAPYRTKIMSALIDVDTRTTKDPSYFITENGKAWPFLCANCGRPDLEVVCWDTISKKMLVIIP